ncbi:GM16332 [Drosophila sechellia]|uniref:GM16332 n=1 Tax=Drosophila sechellia TaxID=7238 RepID=B4IGU3_DROSE|nr:GM16332 [Drosophila sechellia]
MRCRYSYIYTTTPHRSGIWYTIEYWKAQRIQRATTLTSSMSLPAECLVLSVSMPSLNSEPKRPKSAGPKKKPGQAVHSKPFRLY